MEMSIRMQTQVSTITIAGVVSDFRCYWSVSQRPTQLLQLQRVAGPQSFAVEATFEDLSISRRPRKRIKCNSIHSSDWAAPRRTKDFRAPLFYVAPLK